MRLSLPYIFFMAFVLIAASDAQEEGGEEDHSIPTPSQMTCLEVLSGVETNPDVVAECHRILAALGYRGY